MKYLHLAHQYGLGLRQSVEQGHIANERLEMHNILGANFLAWNAGDRWLYPEFVTEVFEDAPGLSEDIAQEFIDFCKKIEFSDFGVKKIEALRENFAKEVLNTLRIDVGH